MATTGSARKDRKRTVEEADDELIRIPAYHYIHVLDLNANVTRLVTGPLKYVRQENEEVVAAPQAMVTVPPDCYCLVLNPAIRDPDSGEVVQDRHGMVKLSHGDRQVRFCQEPFPLYPGEELLHSVTPLTMISPQSALRVRAVSDFRPAGDGQQPVAAGDEWVVRGPGLYRPRKEQQVVDTVHAIVIDSHQAVRVKASRDFTDRKGERRLTGSEWLIRDAGAFLPDAYEQVVEVVDGVHINENSALHMRAIHDGTDAYGKERKSGDEWIITRELTSFHIKDVFEELVKEASVITLLSTQYAVIEDPFDEETSQSRLGQKTLVKGPATFFLKPRERLQNNKVFNVWVAKSDEALLCQAVETHTDEGGHERISGDKWLLNGPLEYIPPIQVSVLELRKSIPLSKNEGIYVRNTKTGVIRLVQDAIYMLDIDEVLWQKSALATAFEYLRVIQEIGHGSVNKYSAACYKIPANRCCRLFDFNENRSRILFGPCLLLLKPQEEITNFLWLPDLSLFLYLFIFLRFLIQSVVQVFKS